MMPLEIANSILCHCWRHDGIASGRLILESICVNGLLLTTNAAKLDGFQIDRGRGVEIMEIMQHPRTSFTDIPFDRMAMHGQRYGRYGVGFKRETIIDWGGLPVWYLPNYWSDVTLKIAGGLLVNSLHGAMHAADHFRVVTQELAKQNISVTVNYAHGPTVGSEQLAKEMEQVKNAVYTVLSFIKEMSPSDVENHSYLLEREWRLVSGMNRTDQTPAYRQLTSAEKETLCATKPAWRKPRESSDVNISSRYGTAPVIDSFQFFNGLPHRATVAQSIDTILVPDESEARWVEKFVIDQPRLFVESAPPRIVIFPGS